MAAKLTAEELAAMLGDIRTTATEYDKNFCRQHLRLIKCGTEENSEELAEKKAAAAARATLLNSDFSPGNVLYHMDEDGDYHFSLVDINRMHFGPVGEKQGCLNFIRLWGPKHFIELLVRSYADARGFDSAKCVAFTLAARRHFWLSYRKKHRVLFKLEL